MPDLVTINDVELVREGAYDLMTGRVDFTRGRLQSAVANAGKGGPAPRIKIAFDEVHAAQANMPSLGNIAGMRLVEDGDVLTIRGDLVGVPQALADIMPSAYPSRSIEASAKGDDMTISALELLGVTAPGVHDIEDLVSLYDGTTEFALAAAAPIQVEDANGDTFTVALASGLNVDDIRSAFYERRNSGGPLGGPFDDWWVDEVHIDPNELIVRNGQSTYRVPWSVDAERAFTFGDAVEVVVQYVDKVSASSGPVVAYRAEIPRPKNDTQEGSTMDAKKLRADIGLAEDASDEDVTAKLAELAARPTSETVTTQVEEAVAAAKAEIAASGGKPPEGFTLIGSDDLAELKASAHDGATARRQQLEDEDAEILAAGCRTGKYGPATRDKLAESMKKNREQTRDLIASLPDGVVPGAEIGGDSPEDLAAAAGDRFEEDAYKAYMKAHHNLEVA